MSIRPIEYLDSPWGEQRDRSYQLHDLRYPSDVQYDCHTLTEWDADSTWYPMRVAENPTLRDRHSVYAQVSEYNRDRYAHAWYDDAQYWSYPNWYISSHRVSCYDDIYSTITYSGYDASRYRDHGYDVRDQLDHPSSDCDYRDPTVSSPDDSLWAGCRLHSSGDQFPDWYITHCPHRRYDLWYRSAPQKNHRTHNMRSDRMRRSGDLSGIHTIRYPYSRPSPIIYSHIREGDIGESGGRIWVGEYMPRILFARRGFSFDKRRNWIE